MVASYAYENDPLLLTDNVGTELNGCVDDASATAIQLKKLAGASNLAGTGQVIVSYKWIVLLLWAVVRLDGSAAVWAIAPLRGVFSEAFTFAVLLELDSLGVFAGTFASFEELVLEAIRVTTARPIFPAALILTIGDWIGPLLWTPGHFGGAVAQPWLCGLTLRHAASSPDAPLRLLGVLSFETAPFYVRAQVTAATGGFVLLGEAFRVHMESYSGMPVGSLSVGLALDTFRAFAKAALLPAALWVLPTGVTDALRLLAQRATLASPAAGGSGAAQDSILREHFLRLLPQYPKRPLA